nr:hypothetical chloroplast RF62 [Ostreobium sp. TRHA14-720]
MKNKNQSSLILVNKVRNFIIKKNLILTKENILISFSGGQDSFCLIFLILQLMNQFQISVGFIYCNHLWSLDNIYKLTHLLKIGFIIHKPTFFTITSKKIFTEEKARIWRYSSLNRISIFYNYKIIFTAHTLTDQIETLLLNLFRGSSKRGVTSLFIKQFIRNKFIKNIFISRKELLLK